MPVTRIDIIEAIRKAKVIDKPEGLRPDMDITEQGVDSLGMFSIVLAVQEACAIQVPDADIDRLRTIDDLVTYVNDQAI